MSEFEDKKIPRSFGTHDGSFHADEVTACALLLLFDKIDQDKIVRTRSLEKLAYCDYVCDVGGVLDASRHLFDHHQADYQGAMSSAGLVLEYLKNTGVVDEMMYRHFSNQLVKGVDDHDNGRDPLIPGLCSYSHVISNFNAIRNDAAPEEQNEAFFAALDFAYGHLRRMYERYVYIRGCRELVQEAMTAGKHVLQFDKSIPWLEVFFELGGQEHPALFVIMPSGEHWKLRGIPPTIQRKMEVRKPLPKKWAGLLDDDLKRETGIKGAIFCHKGRFISVWETREDALKALEFILNNSED